MYPYALLRILYFDFSKTHLELFTLQPYLTAKYKQAHSGEGLAETFRFHMLSSILHDRPISQPKTPILNFLMTQFKLRGMKGDGLLSSSSFFP